MNNGEIIIYQTEDGLAEISLHLKNIFEDNELSEDSVVKYFLTTAADNKKYQTKIYNLDAIMALGFRVFSRFFCLMQWSQKNT